MSHVEMQACSGGTFSHIFSLSLSLFCVTGVQDFSEEEHGHLCSTRVLHPDN